MTSLLPFAPSSDWRRRGGGMRPAGRYTVKVLPLPGSLSSRDLAAEQAGELAADRQAQAGAAVLAAGRAVALRERLEDRLLLVGRDADAGVGDAQGDDAVGRGSAISLVALQPESRPARP